MKTIIFIAVIIIMNITAFSMYGIDKSKAKKGKWRISESALITVAFLMGGIGAFAGMQVFRHKTKHMKFVVLVPLAVVVNVVVAIFVYKTLII